MIRTEDVLFHVGEFTLNRVSLEVNQGEYFVLLGPPGSGKTLFLEALCGLHRIQSGQIIIDGQNVNGLEPRLRRIGYVPQDYALFPHRLVEGNIRFGLEGGELAASEIDRRVQDVVDRLHIRRLLHRQIAGLSGGERQQVALGRALVVRPKVLLLDEPVSALDESTREAVCGELKLIQRELGLTTIHVCHQLQEAFSVADRAGILRNGSFQQIGTMDELIHKPANTFVARFLRCMNILPARVTGPAHRDGWIDIELGRHRFAAPGDFQGEIQLIIRPERIRLDCIGGPQADSVIRLPVEVKQIADRGAYVQMDLDASFPLVLHAAREEFVGLDLHPGMKTAVLIRPESIHILPASQAEYNCTAAQG